MTASQLVGWHVYRWKSGPESVDLEPQDLMTLPRYTAYMRMLIDGMPSRPFSMTTLPPAELTFDTRRPDVIRRTPRHHYCRPVEQVDRAIANTFAIA